MNFRNIILISALLLTAAARADESQFRTIAEQAMKEAKSILFKARTQGLETTSERYKILKTRFADLDKSLPSMVILDAQELKDRGLAPRMQLSANVVMAQYRPFDDSGVLQLADNLDIDLNPCDYSILVHEFVHHIQYLYMRTYQPDSFKYYSTAKPSEKIQTTDLQGGLDQDYKQKELFRGFEAEAFAVQLAWLDKNHDGAVFTYSGSENGVRCELNKAMASPLKMVELN